MAETKTARIAQLYGYGDSVTTSGKKEEVPVFPRTASSGVIHKNADGSQTDVQTALNGKAEAKHTHAIADVSGLQTALNGKQEKGNYADINSTSCYRMITLPKGSWKNGRLTVTGLSAVTASNMVVVSPLPSSASAWDKGNVRYVSQGAGSLSFKSDYNYDKESMAASDIVVGVIVINRTF